MNEHVTKEYPAEGFLSLDLLPYAYSFLTGILSVGLLMRLRKMCFWTIQVLR